MKVTITYEVEANGKRLNKSISARLNKGEQITDESVEAMWKSLREKKGNVKLVK